MGLESFNKSCRSALFASLEETHWDLLVIGGGITGASIFRDAAMRKMKVALVEAKDFASGTSGRSSKLIHGGLRYLKNLGLSLAWESCQERNLHIRLNKRLVRPIPFLMPLYKGKQSQSITRAGMILYEILSGFQNYRLHRFLSREETLSLAPGIPTDGLSGGCIYYDAVVSDGRWTIENIKDGVRHGGVALNYSPVTGLRTGGHTVIGAEVRDSLTGKEHQISASAVVNATGVFADRIRRMAGSDHKPLVRLSKGTHLVFAESDIPLSITTVFSSPVDERPLFLVKREGCFLFGTSDDWEEADPEEPVPGRKDVSYLLESLQCFMPETDLTREKVQFIYSGFRPLLANDAAASASAATREDYVEESTTGLISIIGGKLTTARKMAIKVLDRVIAGIARSSEWLDCETDRHSIGGTNEAVAESFSFWVKQCPQLSQYFRILFQRYGLDAAEICREAKKIYVEEQTDPIRAEVEYVCRHEMVCTVEDLMDRRAGFLYWSAEKRLERLRFGAAVIRGELGLTQEEFEIQVQQYREHLHRYHSLPDLGR